MSNSMKFGRYVSIAAVALSVWGLVKAILVIVSYKAFTASATNGSLAQEITNNIIAEDGSLHQLSEGAINFLLGIGNGMIMVLLMGIVLLNVAAIVLGTLCIAWAGKREKLTNLFAMSLCAAVCCILHLGVLSCVAFGVACYFFNKAGKEPLYVSGSVPPTPPAA